MNEGFGPGELAAARRLQQLGRVSAEVMKEIEDATNPVESLDAAEDARQELVRKVRRREELTAEEAAEFRRAVAVGEVELPDAVRRYVMPPVSEEMHGAYTVPPRTGGVLPSPGHEAERARGEVAQLRLEVTALRQGMGNAQATWGEHFRAVESQAEALRLEMEARLSAAAELLARHAARIEALESKLGDTQASWERRFEALEGQQKPESYYLIYFREKGQAEWSGPMEFTSEAEALQCYQAWALDGIHEGKMETRQRGQSEADRREDAVWAKGYRAGFWDGGGGEKGGSTAFQSEVDAAHARWVEGGRKTHLDEVDG